MALNKAYNQYKQNSIYTSTPEELTLMLYNGLIRFIMQAQSSIDERDIEKASNSIARAEDIIQHFRITLDMKYQVSQGLDALYEYMFRRLVEANMKKDQEILAEILGMAKELRDTWTQAMKLAKIPVHLQQILQPEQPRAAAQE
jgi:flagellar protein FliS